MNGQEPPRIAAWLLKRLAAGSNRESLIGDLTEQYPRKRSSAWYWRQAVIAIVASAYQDLRDHKWLAVRAILTASAFRLVEKFLLGFVMLNIFDGFAWTMTLPPVTRE